MSGWCSSSGWQGCWWPRGCFLTLPCAKLRYRGAERMRRYLRLYLYFLNQRFKILMEYRANFIIGATSTIFLQAASLLTIWVVMSQIPSLNGWDLNEVLLIYGLLTASKSITH